MIYNPLQSNYNQLQSITMTITMIYNDIQPIRIQLQLFTRRLQSITMTITIIYNQLQSNYNHLQDDCNQ